VLTNPHSSVEDALSTQTRLGGGCVSMSPCAVSLGCVVATKLTKCLQMEPGLHFSSQRMGAAVILAIIVGLLFFVALNSIHMQFESESISNLCFFSLILTYIEISMFFLFDPHLHRNRRLIQGTH